MTVGLYGVLFWFTDWATLGETLRDANPWLIAVFVGMMFGSVTISAHKWRLILRIHDLHFALSRLQRYYFIAMFFNNFLPSSIGGDGYRVYKTLDNPRGRLFAVAAVVIERATGFAAMLVLGYLAAVVMYFRTGDDLAGTVTRVETVIGGACLVGLALIIGVRRFREHLPTRWIPEKVRTVARFVGDYRRHRMLSFRVIAISFLFQAWNLTLYWILLDALGAHTTFPVVMLLLTLAGIVAFLPITLNGIGLTDGAFIGLAVHYGVSYEAALSCMLLVRLVNAMVSAVGAWFYFSDGHQHPPTRPAAGPSRPVRLGGAMAT